MIAKGYWFAFAIGVAAGVSIALLYAPQTGVKTRRRLRNGIDGAGDYLEDAGDYMKAQAERLSQEAQATIKRTKEHTEEAVDVLSNAGHSALRQAKSLV